jgi:hypothetical protein
MAAIVARYSQHLDAAAVAVAVARESHRQVLSVAPAAQETLDRLML